MHEISVVQALMTAVQNAVPANARLVEVQLDVGTLEHLDAGVLQEAWNALTEGTPWARSSLSVRRIPARIRCRTCGCEYVPDDICVLFCPDCGAARPEVIQGTGVALRALEVDDEEVEDGSADHRERVEAQR